MAEGTLLRRLRIANYRVLRDVEFNALTPLTALVGPNGSGKSTVLETLEFLASCFDNGPTRAIDKHGGLDEIRSRGAEGPIEIEVEIENFRKDSCSKFVYKISLGDSDSGSVEFGEALIQLEKGKSRKSVKLLSFKNGEGWIVPLRLKIDKVWPTSDKVKLTLRSREALGASVFSNFAPQGPLKVLRDFITGWRFLKTFPDKVREPADLSAQRQLGKSGHNLANVVNYLRSEEREALENVTRQMRKLVPGLKSVEVDESADGRLALKAISKAFKKPIPAEFMSDGTLSLLAYLVMLSDPQVVPLLGIEEPENHVHPQLHRRIGGLCREAANRTQIIATTHSPFFLNDLNADEVKILWTDDSGFAKVLNAERAPGVPEFLKEGGLLGSLWMEGLFRVGNPLRKSGQPTFPIGD